MAHHSYPAGRSGSAAQWPDGSAVTPDEFAWLASCAFKSINGDDGGTWAPAAVITIGGAGVAFTTVATTFFGITVTGHTVLNTLGVLDYVGITGNLSAGGAISFSGGSSDTHKTLTVGQYVDSTIYGTVVFGNTVTVNNAATFTGNAVFSGTGSRALTVGADYVVTLSGINTLASLNMPSTGLALIDAEIRAAGGIRQPIETFTASGTITAGARHAVCNIAAGGYVQLPTGHPINAPIKIINKSTLALEVRSPAGTRLFDVQDATTATKWAEVYYDGSSWLVLVDNGIIA